MSPGCAVAVAFFTFGVRCFRGTGVSKDVNKRAVYRKLKLLIESLSRRRPVKERIINRSLSVRATADESKRRVGRTFKRGRVRRCAPDFSFFFFSSFLSLVSAVVVANNHPQTD